MYILRDFAQQWTGIILFALVVVTCIGYDFCELRIDLHFRDNSLFLVGTLKGKHSCTWSSDGFFFILIVYYSNNLVHVANFTFVFFIFGLAVPQAKPKYNLCCISIPGNTGLVLEMSHIGVQSWVVLALQGNLDVFVVAYEAQFCRNVNKNVPNLLHTLYVNWRKKLRLRIV